jgi:hypothetical protein
VQNKAGPAESSFQAALYSALNGLLPEPLMCLFEANAENRDELDLMVVDNEQGSFLFGYELKVNKITAADFQGPLQQAKKYADHFRMEIHLINFWLEGMSVPVRLASVTERVTVVNVQHNASCTEFIMSTRDGNEIKVESIALH